MGACRGGRVYLENNLRRVRERLEEDQPTIFFGVPALFEIMYRAILSRAESGGRLHQFQAWQARVRWLKRLTGLNLGPLVFRQVHRAMGGRIRLLVSGAAALKPQTALDYFSLGLPLLQGWGMAETSSAVATQRSSRLRFLFTRYYERHVGSVGLPLSGIEVRLLDVPEKGIYVELQHEGEVALRGSSIFQGYWQAPEASAAAMADGWLRTGDLGRIEKDGSIYLTGRSKYVIVLDSGEKVYPDELEMALEESYLIADVCVTGRASRDKTVVTAVIYPDVEAVLARGRELAVAIDATAVQDIITAEVGRIVAGFAAYKRISRIELSDQPLPKTALRKVARGRLDDCYEFDYQCWLESATAPADA